MGNSARDIQTAQQTTGKLFRIKFAEIVETDKIDGIFHILTPERFVADIQTTEIINVFIDGQFLKDSDILHDNADLTFQIVAVRPHFPAEDPDGSLVKGKQCKDAVDGCRLSGAVWSKQTEDLTFLDREIKVIEGDKLLIAFYQIFYFYNRY